MAADWGLLAGVFTEPIHIATDPWSMLWMFPLLLAIAIVYKATKMRVLFVAKFVKEVAILFGTISAFMVFLGVALILLVKLITE
jgi:hypothetical protein